MIQDHKNRVASMNADQQFIAAVEEIERKIEHKIEHKMEHEMNHKNIDYIESINIIDQALDKHLKENPITEISSYFNQIKTVGNSALYWKMKSAEDKDGIQADHNTDYDRISTDGICGDHGGS